MARARRGPPPRPGTGLLPVLAVRPASTLPRTTITASGRNAAHALLEHASEDDDLDAACQILDLQRGHALSGGASTRHERTHIADGATHLDDESVEMRAELVDGGVDALLQLAGDAAQRVIAQIHPEELALPAEALVRRDGERPVDVAALEVVGRV